MDTFAKELKCNSEKNMMKRIEQDALKNQQKVEIIINENEMWFNKIIEGYKDKMEDASEQGYRYCILDYFNVNDVVAAYKKGFLMFGPYNDNGKGKGLDYFNNVNIVPLKERINKFFHPIKIDVKYNKKEKINKIIAYW